MQIVFTAKSDNIKNFKKSFKNTFRFLNFSAYYICKVKNPKKLSAFQMVTSFFMLIKPIICISASLWIYVCN